MKFERVRIFEEHGKDVINCSRNNVGMNRRRGLGNPYPMKNESERNWAIDNFKNSKGFEKKCEKLLDIIKKQYPFESVIKLGCYCPLDKRCHVDEYIKFLEEEVGG